MAVSQHVVVPLAAVVMLLFAGGAQAWTCPAGYQDCDKDYNKNGCEVNVHTDVNNCGYCGHKCALLCGANVIPVCKAAKCEFSCKAPYLNCDHEWKNGCEVDGSKDEYNCGACGNKCKEVPYAFSKCNGGKCEHYCKPGYSNCDGDWNNGCETATGYDNKSCGACNVTCPYVPNAVTKCKLGKCEYYCKPGYSNCDGDWKNGCENACNSDPKNCGACGVKCADHPNAYSKCVSSKCVYWCKPGYANCDYFWKNGCESYLATDAKNCGRCGHKCPYPTYAGGEAKCTYGQCEAKSCKQGWKWEAKKNCCVDGGKGKGGGGKGKGGGRGGKGGWH